MLNIAAAFPNPGSYATATGLRGTVRIQRINSDGTRLIAGEFVSPRTVPLSRLRAAPKPEPEIVEVDDEFYVYLGEQLVRACPSRGMAHQVAAAL